MRIFIFSLTLAFFYASNLFAETSLSLKVDADIVTIKTTLEKMRNDFNKVPANDKNIDWVKSKIKNMFDVDQYFRMTEMNLPVEHEYTAEERSYFEKMVRKLFKEVDSSNTADIKSLIQIYHWFRISQFGKEIDYKAWLLVQHADDDPDFQKSILGVLEDLVKVGETNPTDFAYLFDRVAASWSDPAKRTLQRFGTQGRCMGVNKWEPIPIEEPENVNTRRAGVGLSSIEEYQNQMNKYCK